MSASACSTLPDVLAGLSERDALALWWFQTRMQLEMIASGMTMRDAFDHARRRSGRDEHASASAITTRS